MFYALVIVFILIFWLILAVCVLRDKVHDLWLREYTNDDRYEEEE